MTRDAALSPRAGLPGDDTAGAEEPLILADLVNRVLDKGVVISGHITIAVADVDLIALDLRVLLTSIETAIAGTRTAPPPSSF